MFVTSRETQDLLRTSKFDLIVIDGLFNDCGYGVAYKLNPKPKVILYGTSNIFSWWYEPFGLPSEASWISDSIVAFPSPMAFWERTITAMLVPLTYYVKVWFFYPRLETLLREELEIPDMPPLVELEREVSLVLLNSHFSEDFARSLPPLFVSVGGVHIKDTSKSATVSQNVAADLQKFMDESGEDGFIYVSFGSVAKLSTAPSEIQDMFFDAFRSTKCRFVLKWEGGRPKQLPANVFTANWMPQQRILSHPKAKAFVTHGGMLSLSEAVQNAIPVIMFPIYAEQDFNSMRFEKAQRGIRLEISRVTGPELRDAFNEIRTNQIYKVNMLKTKALYDDRPHSPLETAIWWTEYVHRHDDLSSLKPLSMNQTWYERRLLDVWAFIGVTVLLLSLVVLFILRVVKKVLCFFLCFGSDYQIDDPRSRTISSNDKVKVKKN